MDQELDIHEDDQLDYDQGSNDNLLLSNDDFLAEESVSEGNCNNDPLSQPIGSPGIYDSVELDSGMKEMLASCSNENANQKQNCSTNSLDSFLEAMCTSNAKTGPAVKGVVGKFFTNQLSRDFSKISNSKAESSDCDSDSVLSKMKKVFHPANVEELQPCIVNASVYKAMPPNAKKSNFQAQLAEQAVCKSLSHQAKLMEGLLELKENIQPEGAQKLQSLLKLSGDSVELLAFSRARINEGRRNTILSNINNTYKPLGSRTKAEKGLLFGNDLAGAMREVEDSNKLAKKLSKPDFNNAGGRAPFLGRGRGRGRGQRNPQYSTAQRGNFNRPVNRGSYRGKNYQR